jgi:hypothetical protein
LIDHGVKDFGTGNQILSTSLQLMNTRRMSKWTTESKMTKVKANSAKVRTNKTTFKTINLASRTKTYKVSSLFRTMEWSKALGTPHPSLLCTITGKFSHLSAEPYTVISTGTSCTFWFCGSSSLTPSQMARAW